jgi:hypothetical protein
MHSNVTVLILKSNKSELAKKKCSFLDYFFFYRSLKLVHLQLHLLGSTDLSCSCNKIIFKGKTSVFVYLKYLYKLTAFLVSML